MNPDQVVALLMVVADLQLRASALAAELEREKAKNTALAEMLAGRDAQPPAPA